MIKGFEYSTKTLYSVCPCFQPQIPNRRRGLSAPWKGHNRIRIVWPHRSQIRKWHCSWFP